MDLCTLAFFHSWSGISHTRREIAPKAPKTDKDSAIVVGVVSDGAMSEDAGGVDGKRVIHSGLQMQEWIQVHQEQDDILEKRQ